ncbi:oxidoreductase [Cohnella sp. CIP 111063]|uniref:Gfo/Idh/MocA family protein n=1 Tax=unclassified Cohnella TaxID=2636738 RepID=UPI000B8BB7DC|nr:MULTISPECIES: Gfo/Idh/MocA family oxidoreductase [unclassified Cohnella]OXS55931.1 oxidoreductase [Cohnella sp. CIP 111063]PRX67136.1 putative dehydrogenase [Cohnella sp. SGD-V74]
MVNFALVGCGFIANKHSEAISEIEDACIYAVCDKIEQNMVPYKEKHSALTYNDYDLLLQDPNVQVVNICTPSGTHAALAIKAAKAGKHVILEKPMALNEKDANDIILACRANNVKLAVVHPNRFRPALIELKKLLESGAFGTISHINATVRWNRDKAYYSQAPWRGSRAMDGGVLMNQAIHNLDLLLWLMGPVEQLKAFTSTRYREIECEDVAVAIATFKSGALGVIEAATTIYPKNLEESISIFGEKGTAVIRGVHANEFEHLSVEGLSEEQIGKIKNAAMTTQQKSGHAYIIEDMINCISQDNEPLVGGEDGKNALELVLAITKAAESKI